MWHSAMAAVDVLTQQHLLVGGLGGVIAVIVGGVVSIVAARASRRAVAQPAVNPQPAPASRRPATSPVYGAPAPPTSPARRLHPGPISLGAPTRPQRDEDEPIATSLFNPDIFGGAQTEPEETLAELGAEASGARPAAPIVASTAEPSAPLPRSISSVTAEWRPQAAPAAPPELTHAPIWNRSPFAWPDRNVEAPPTAAINFESAPPIWSSLGDRSASGEPPRPDAPAPHAPIWQSRLSGLAAEAPTSDGIAPTELASDNASDERYESAPPIWPSFLRPE